MSVTHSDAQKIFEKDAYEIMKTVGKTPLKLQLVASYLYERFGPSVAAVCYKEVSRTFKALNKIQSKVVMGL